MTPPATRVQVFVADEPEEVARAAAADVAAAVRRVPDAAILFAVGETPVPLYAELAARRAAGDLDTSRVRAVQLDEYVGVPPTDERAFFGWLERDVLGPLAIARERTTALRGDSADPAAECERYERAVREAGGIDLAILGLGLNGHLGFNEPPSAADAPTRVVDLAEPTIEASAGYWGSRELVPPRGITAGMRVLLAARETILVVTGERKRDILRAALEGPVTPDVPASLLRTIERVRVHADRAAWSR